jgi:hypothetical protein
MFLVRASATSRLFGGAALSALGLTIACERTNPETQEPLAAAKSSIVGGKLDTSHKGVVSLLSQVEGGYYPSCSGTLLTQNLVLTAQHCVAALDSSDGASVECGKTKFNATTRPSRLLISVEANVGQEGLNPYRVAEVWVPPGTSDVCGRDVALLLLSGSGVPASSATPIEPRLTRDLAPNEVFAAIGYGLQDPGDETGETAGHRMQVTNAQVFCGGTACGTNMVAENEFIADSPVCSGDSGGPALDNDGRVSGVTSRGDQECTVGIYSSVAAWRDFIVEKTFVAAQSGHYVPPTWAGQPPPGFDPGVPAPSGGSANGGTGSDGSGGKLTLAGSGGSGMGGTGSMSPTIDPLGISCTGACPGSYKCWAATSKPPGICVPACSAAQPSCPEGYACDTALAACTKPQTKSVQHSGSCSVRATGDRSTGGGTWLSLGALGLSSYVFASRRARRARPR